MSSTSMALTTCSNPPGQLYFNGTVFGATRSAPSCPTNTFPVPPITLQAAGCGYTVVLTNTDGSKSYLQPPAGGTGGGSLVSSTPYLWTATPAGPAFTLQNPADKTFIGITPGTSGAATTFTALSSSAGAAVFECLNGIVVLSGTASNGSNGNPPTATFLLQKPVGAASAILSTDVSGPLESYSSSSVVDTNASVSNIQGVFPPLYLGPLSGGLLSLLPTRAGALTVVPASFINSAQYAVYILPTTTYENPGSYSPGTVSCAGPGAGPSAGPGAKPPASKSQNKMMIVGVSVAASVVVVAGLVVLLYFLYIKKKAVTGVSAPPPK